METEKSEQTQRETEAQKTENATAISIRGARHFGGDPHLARQFAQWDGEAELWKLSSVIYKWEHYVTNWHVNLWHFYRTVIDPEKHPINTVFIT